MKKRLSHFAYNERSRSSWTLTIPHFTPLSPIRSTIKTVTYVPGTFVTLVSGPHTPFSKGEFTTRRREKHFAIRHSKIIPILCSPLCKRGVRGDLCLATEIMTIAIQSHRGDRYVER